MTYPSIVGPTLETLDEPCLAFHKYDGSNLRFFWSQQKGWYQFGTRYRFFKQDNPMFGPAIPLFLDQFADGILTTLRQHKEYRNVAEVIAFCEFFGPSSFSGLHTEQEPKELVFFDLYIQGRNFVPPHDFVQHFGHVRIAEVVYTGPFSRQFIRDVFEGTYSVKEGVVAKGMLPQRQRKGKTEYKRWMAKIKTQTWMDELLRRSATSEDLRREYEENIQQQTALDQLDADDDIPPWEKP